MTEVRPLRKRGRSPRVVATSFYVEAPGMRAWLRSGIRLATLAPPDGDPDRLLRLASCRLIKDQRKVTVGLTPVEIGDREDAAHAGTPIYIKRYNVFSWRVRLLSLLYRSPAFLAWEATGMLTAAGFRTAAPIAAVEYRRWGMLRKSFFLTASVEDAVAADQYWWRLRRADRRSRRAFIAGLARLFADLHAAGIYHGDLKDANVLVRMAPDGAPECHLLDLERVRQRRGVSMRRRVKNLVQLHRTLGRLASIRENLYFLRCYLGDKGRVAHWRRRWRRAVCAAAWRKDLRHALRWTT